MMSVFLFHHGDERTIVKFCPVVHFGEGICHGLPRLVFQWFHLSLLGEDVDRDEEVQVTLVVLGQGLHFRQVCHPLLFDVEHQHR